MVKEIYLSLEKQKCGEYMFSYALVYRGTDNPETACIVEGEINDLGSYSVSYINSDAEKFELDSDVPTRKEARDLSRRILHLEANKIRSALGAELMLMKDQTQ